MFINPKIAIAEGWVRGINDEKKQLQPNAIDFTVDNLYAIKEITFVISEEVKQMRGGDEMIPTSWRPGSHPRPGNEDTPYWHVQPHTVVDFMSNMYVEIPEGVACQLIIRSTFNRNGLFLTSGLYDSGFRGHIAGALHNRSGVALIAPGTRLGQIVFISSDSAGVYAGGYNHEQGTHHTSPQDLDCDGAEARDNKTR